MHRDVKNAATEVYTAEVLLSAAGGLKVTETNFTQCTLKTEKKSSKKLFPRNKKKKQKKKTSSFSQPKNLKVFRDEKKSNHTRININSHV